MTITLPTGQYHPEFTPVCQAFNERRLRSKSIPSHRARDLSPHSLRPLVPASSRVSPWNQFIHFQRTHSPLWELFTRVRLLDFCPNSFHSVDRGEGRSFPALTAYRLSHQPASVERAAPPNRCPQKGDLTHTLPSLFGAPPPTLSSFKCSP